MVERERIGLRGAAEESEKGNRSIPNNMPISGSLGGDSKGRPADWWDEAEEYRPEGGVPEKVGEPKDSKNVSVGEYVEGGIVRYNTEELRPNKEGGLSPTNVKVRIFEGGATRDTDSGKLDYEGFFSPLVLKRRAEYMHKHRQQSDGKLRASDNWQRGIPVGEYMKSMLRHIMDVWLESRGYDSREGIEEALCGLMFNAEGYLYEILEKN